jgi:2-octaprenyl-6-methoxyphenol hydroxylase
MAGFDADVLIVGGGVVGLSLALAVDAAGLSVALLDRTAAERRAEPDFDGRAYALAAASVKAFEALGVWPAVAAHAEPMREILISDGRPGRPGRALLRFDGAELDRAPFAMLLEDRWLRRALLEAVAARPGIAHRAPADVAGMTVDEGAATVALADGGTLGARLVVACDGRRSALAAQAGIGWTGGRYAQTGLVCALACEKPHHGVARQIFYPGGPFAMLPLPENRVSIVWSEREAEAARLQALPDDRYLAEVLARTGGALGRATLAGRRWAYPLELALAYAYVAPRLALAGDAAHAVHPIAGQGFNIALRDVAALAETLAEARRRGEDPGAEAVLARYQRWRRFDATVFAAATDGLNRLFSNDSALLRLARGAGLRLVDAAPPLKRLFMEAAAGWSGETPRLLRGEAP